MTSRGRPISGSELEDSRIQKRTRTAKNHLDKLSKIADELDPITYNRIVSSLNPIIKQFQEAYNKSK